MQPAGDRYNVHGLKREELISKLKKWICMKRYLNLGTHLIMKQLKGVNGGQKHYKFKVGITQVHLELNYFNISSINKFKWIAFRYSIFLFFKYL